MTNKDYINYIAQDLLTRLNNAYFDYNDGDNLDTYAAYQVALTDTGFLMKFFGNSHHINIWLLTSRLSLLRLNYKKLSKQKRYDLTVSIMKLVVIYGGLTKLQAEEITSIDLGSKNN